MVLELLAAGADMAVAEVDTAVAEADIVLDNKEKLL